MRAKLLRITLVLALGAAGGLFACGAEPRLEVQVAPAEPTGSAPRPTSARLPAGHPPVANAPPAAPAHGALPPPGHPPMTTRPALSFELPPVVAGTGTGAAGLRWTPPAAWVAAPPANAMRRAQYRVPGPDGDAECVVFYFGPGQGGDPRSNVERWAAQFVTADGQPGTAVMKTREIDAGGIRILVVEVRGTYLAGSAMGMAPSRPRPGQALLGAVVEGPDANWFFKLTGPEATVEAQRVGFDAMLASLKKGD